MLCTATTDCPIARHHRIADEPIARRRSRRSPQRGGFTLLEVLIATAATLLMMLSLAQIFKVVGDSMKQGRAALELNNSLRSVAYRIRIDLENLTAVPNPPADPSSGLGYIEYYDGSLTDYSATLYSATEPTVTVNLSRFGDVDDIFMGTASAGDVWFNGKVPLFVLKQSEPSTADLNGNGIADDVELVNIAAQHAEVVMFVEPVVTNIGNPSRDPSYYLTSTPNGAINFQDTDNLDGGGNGFPDAFRLHYRTLLIRPDLNLASSLSLTSGQTIAAGNLPASVNAANSYLVAQPQGGSLPSPLCDMSTVHNQCDLSVRRVFNPADGLPATADFIAANSLEDLVDPANRFAHVQVPIPGTASTTLPLLALGPKLALGTLTSVDPDGQLSGGSFQVGTGFLHPAYLLRGSRTGEDVLASEILAFDIKGFDPGVPLLGSVGPDTAYGIAGDDDDGDGTPDNASELGWANSDDLILSPNDPGYGPALATAAPAVSVVGTGEYVDLCWARKLAAHGANITATTNVWSPLSGYSLSNIGNGSLLAFSDELYKSGKVLRAGTATYVLQPSYDTWTTRYEGDGILQAARGTVVGNMRINGGATLYGLAGNDLTNVTPVWRRTNVDAGTDGIDNNGSAPGVDDVTELETSPPFASQLRGLRISIRMEDPVTRQVKQMSVAREFVTQ
jgi:hypothetical protein